MAHNVDPDVAQPPTSSHGVGASTPTSEEVRRNSDSHTELLFFSDRLKEHYSQSPNRKEKISRLRTIGRIYSKDYISFDSHILHSRILESRRRGNAPPDWSLKTPIASD